MKDFFAGRSQPMTVTFRSNVGYRPPEHWLHDPVEGGGVILGEAIHFVDFCHWLIGAPPIEVTTTAVDGEQAGMINADNVHITLRFGDGSIATIVYVLNGDPAAGRERVEALAEGGVAVLEDFRRLQTVRKGKRRTYRKAPGSRPRRPDPERWPRPGGPGSRRSRWKTRRSQLWRPWKRETPSTRGRPGGSSRPMSGSPERPGELMESGL